MHEIKFNFAKKLNKYYSGVAITYRGALCDVWACWKSIRGDQGVWWLQCAAKIGTANWTAGVLKSALAELKRPAAGRTTAIRQNIFI